LGSDRQRDQQPNAPANAIIAGAGKNRAWIFPMMRVLARLNGLRGTAFDPFGHAAKRRVERDLGLRACQRSECRQGGVATAEMVD
jgi:hypothetical protein